MLPEVAGVGLIQECMNLSRLKVLYPTIRACHISHALMTPMKDSVPQLIHRAANIMCVGPVAPLSRREGLVPR